MLKGHPHLFTKYLALSSVHKDVNLFRKSVILIFFIKYSTLSSVHKAVMCKETSTSFYISLSLCLVLALWVPGQGLCSDVSCRGGHLQGVITVVAVCHMEMDVDIVLSCVVCVCDVEMDVDTVLSHADIVLSCVMCVCVCMHVRVCVCVCV